MAHQLPIDAAAPIVVIRRVRPGDDDAHLFLREGPGWMHSLCRAVSWSSALRSPDDIYPVGECADCGVAAGALGAVVV